MKRKTFVGLLVILTMLISGCDKSMTPENGKLSELVSTIELAEQGESDTVSSKVPDLNDTVAIYMKINPEVILYVDMNQIVVFVEMVNQEAKDAYEHISFKGMFFSDVIETMIDICLKQKYLTIDNLDIVIVPVEKNENDVILASQVIESSTEQINDYISEKKLNITVITKNSMEDSLISTRKPTDIAIITTSDVLTEELQESMINCSMCNGKGVCNACKGTGYLDGATATCKACNGAGFMKCSFCKNGTMSCNYCGGDGIDNSETCSKCGGSGEKSCQYCGGRGEYACMHCPGDGVNRYYCTECSDGITVGDGKCKKCNVTGFE